MSWSDKDKFYVPGRVGADEWNWRKEFTDIVKFLKKDPQAYMNFDVGKILGLVTELDRKEKQLDTITKLADKILQEPNEVKAHKIMVELLDEIKGPSVIN